MASKNANNKNSVQQNKNKQKEQKLELKQKTQKTKPKNPPCITKAYTEYKTHAGHKLTPKEAKYIDIYVETGNQRQSVIQAGYATKSPGQYAQLLMAKTYISEEIDFRLKMLENEKIASAEEILKYFTGVMRGEIKDQFGLDTPLSERTKAAQELAKRKIDIVERLKGNKEATDNTITIKLDWNGMNATVQQNEEEEENYADEQ